MRDLKADLEICNKATRGPWEHGQWFYDPSGHGECSISQTGEMYDHAKVYGTNNHKYEAEGKANAEFIAEAREGWPHAIDRAIKAEAEVERLRLMVKSITGGLDECMETVHFLEAENAQLRKVAEAARVYVMEHDKIPNLRTLDEWIIIVAAIRNALTELDKEGER